jgi:predicted AAA+ superfamily ATPase
MRYKRSFQAPQKESFFLFGPRGVGKTTWLKEAYPNALWVDLLNPKEEREFSMRPELLMERLEASPSDVVVLDEIQKVPKLLDVVHLLIESKKNIQFVLTGSSSRKLRRQGVNLLAGRALWKQFHPFTAWELGKDFSLERALKTGLIPLVWSSEDQEAKLDAYVDLYLQEEVKAEALVRNVGEFARFLEVMAFSHGATLNLSNISRNCGIPRKTVEGHLQILQDLLLGYTLPVFERRAKREMASHLKFYFFDPGVFRALKKEGFLDSSTEAEGAALEGLVAEHLRSWIDLQKDKMELSTWRTRAGLEVDFVVYGPNIFWAIEVKNGTVISPSDLRGLKEFQKDFPEAATMLLYRGQERLIRDGILCENIERWLQAKVISLQR